MARARCQIGVAACPPPEKEGFHREHPRVERRVGGTSVRTPMREPGRPRVIERHITTDFARDTVAKAFYEVILDGMGYGPRDLTTNVDREWLRGAIAMPIQEATELALHDLARRLGHALEGAPDGSARRFHSSHAGEELRSE
jgi:hypothetical protein